MKLQIEIAGALRSLDVSRAGQSGEWRVMVEGQTIDADVRELRPGVWSLLVEGRSLRIVADEEAGDPVLHIGSQRSAYRLEDPRSLRQRRRAAGSAGPVTLKASMPGRVVRVLAAKGDTVAAHQAVLVIEAMKMQNEMKSPKEGRIADLRVAAGDTVASGQILAVIE